MLKKNLMTIVLVVGALALYLGFMGWMSHERYLQSQSPVLEIKDVDQFNKEMDNAQLPVFIFFYVKGHAGSDKEAPLVERVAKDYQGRVKFLKVNAKNVPEIPLNFGIDRAPSYLLANIKEKRGKAAFGLMDVPELKQLIDDFINSKPQTPAPAQPQTPAPAQPQTPPAPDQPKN